jgi:hypothetical protein
MGENSMTETILVLWDPKEDLNRIFPEKTARLLSGMVPIRGILKDYGAEGGLMSCLHNGEKMEIPVLLDELTEVRLS